MCVFDIGFIYSIEQIVVINKIVMALCGVSGAPVVISDSRLSINRHILCSNKTIQHGYRTIYYLVIQQ